VICEANSIEELTTLNYLDSKEGDNMDFSLWIKGDVTKWQRVWCSDPLDIPNMTLDSQSRSPKVYTTTYISLFIATYDTLSLRHVSFSWLLFLRLKEVTNMGFGNKKTCVTKYQFRGIANLLLQHITNVW